MGKQDKKEVMLSIASVGELLMDIENLNDAMDVIISEDVLTDTDKKLFCLSIIRIKRMIKKMLDVIDEGKSDEGTGEE
jgi:riboflavin synthase